jgi:glycosyltransferase involved in cell wall biosynthesis
MGDGNQRDTLKSAAARASLPNLRFMTLQPELLYASVLAAADALLVNQRGTVRDMALPSKLTSYFASGRPVIAAVAPDSESAVEVRASAGGIVCAPDDPAALLEAISLVAGDPALAPMLGRNGQLWARDVLSEPAALAGYEALIGTVLAAGTRTDGDRTHSSNVGRPSPAVVPKRAQTVAPTASDRRPASIADAGAIERRAA